MQAGGLTEGGGFATGAAGGQATSRTGRRGLVALGNAFRIAIDTLWAHKLRSLLTVFGIVVGIAAVTRRLLCRGLQLAYRAPPERKHYYEAIWFLVVPHGEARPACN